MTSVQGTFVLDILGANVEDYDRLIVGHNGSFTALDLNTFTDSMAINFSEDFADVAEDAILFPVITQAGSLHPFRDIVEGQRVTHGGYAFNVSYKGDAVTGAVTERGSDLAFYNFSAVPEPGAGILVVLFFTATSIRRRGRLPRGLVQAP